MNQELEHTKNESSNASENKPSYLTTRAQIPNTPFWLVVVNRKWFIAMAEHRLTEEMGIIGNEEEEVTAQDLIQYGKELLELEKWNIIMRVAGVVHSKIAQEAAKEMERTELQRQYERTKDE